MKPSTILLQVLHVASWVMFIGLCIKTGALLVSFLVSLLVNPEGAKNLYMGLDLHDLLAVGKGYYIQAVSFILVFTGLKAYIAFLVTRIFAKFSLDQPFDQKVTATVLKISTVALEAGIVAFIANTYSDWMDKKGVEMPFEWGHGEILFFAGVIYVVAKVLEKGTEIQAENELTI